MRSIELEERVQYYDTDCGGVVSNIAYLRWVEKARSELFAGLGLSPSDSMERMLFPAVVRTEIDYRRPARLGETVRIAGAIESFEKVRVHCRFTLELRSPHDSRVVAAEARQTVALVQLPAGRPVRIPEEWQSKIEG